jgi:predicted regulator of Ras-like GTPase activity (Roadblock/LC7/MglB family)
MAIEGNLRDMNLASIIQHQCQEVASSQVALEWRGKTGTLYFGDGEVIHAATATLSGEDAVYELLRWTEGTFRVTPSPVTPERTIHKNWSNLLLDGMQRIDEGGSSMADRWEQLAHELRGVSAVNGSVIVARDGVVLAADMDSDPEREGAVAVFVGNAAHEIGEVLELGSFDWGVVTMGQDRMFITDQPTFCIGALLGERASPTLIADEARRVLEHHKN